MNLGYFERQRNNGPLPGGCFIVENRLVNANGDLLAELEACPLCNRQAERDDRQVLPKLKGVATGYDCLSCGQFVILHWALSSGYQARQEMGDHGTLPFLSGVIREITERRRQQQRARYKLIPPRPVPILVNSLRSTIDPSPAFVGIAELLARDLMTRSERLDRTLKNLRTMTEHEGQWLQIWPEDYPLAFAENPDMFAFSLEALNKQGLIRYSSVVPIGEPLQLPVKVQLTDEGLARAEELNADEVGGQPAGKTEPMMPDSNKTHSGGIERLLAIGGNRENIRRLIEQLRSSRGIIPFVGAGLSVPFNMPGWTSFLLEQADAVDKRTEIEAFLIQGKYEEAAGMLETELTPFQFHFNIEAAYGDHKLTGQRLAGAVAHLPALATGPVLTTNFDRVLERVFDTAKVPFEHIVYGAKPDMIGRAMRQGRRRLLKLHGDWEERTERILTKVEYDRHYGMLASGDIDFSQPLPRLMRDIITGNSLLFLGCSLNQDRTVSALRLVAQQTQEMVHFAIVEQPTNKLDQIAKARHMAEHHILPIWYPTGEHENIELLLRHVVNQTTWTVSGGATNTEQSELPYNVEDPERLPWLSMHDAQFSNDAQVQILQKKGWTMGGGAVGSLGQHLAGGSQYVIWKQPGTNRLYRLFDGYGRDPGPLDNIWLMHK